MRVKEVSDVRYVMCDITHMNCIRRNACWWSQANEIWNTGNGFYKTKTELFHKFLLMLQFILFVHLIQTDDLVSKTEVDDKVDTTIVRFRFYFAHDSCLFFFNNSTAVYSVTIRTIPNPTRSFKVINFEIISSQKAFGSSRPTEAVNGNSFSEERSVSTQ